MKTGQWYHGSMARPVNLDTEPGKDGTSQGNAAGGSASQDPHPHHHKSRFPSQQPTNEDGQKLPATSTQPNVSNFLIDYLQRYPQL